MSIISVVVGTECLILFGCEMSRGKILWTFSIYQTSHIYASAVYQFYCQNPYSYNFSIFFKKKK